MSIQAIPTASVAKICSGQVILDLSTAVKELVENALDAGATCVEVRLREHGLQLIEVADNGKGVPPEDYAALALKYHTSKISQFQDLESLHTYGFRGEALSSLSALGDLSVITRTANQAAATRLEFDRDGRLTSSSPVARAVGTTVAVKDLFAALPVRRQEFARNVRREVAKLKLLLQQYAIMSTQAQLFASDQAGKAARTVLVSTSNSGSSMLERLSAVLGSKVAAVLMPIEVKLQDDEGVTISGLVSRAGCGVKGEKLRQFCCINGRPVELPRAIKTLNDTYKSLYSSLVGLRPMAFLSFELPAGTFDINVTPDKRSVFMQREVAIVNALGQALQALWEPSRYSYAVNTTQAAFDSQRQAAPADNQPPAAAAPEAEADDGTREADADDCGGAVNASSRSMQDQQQQEEPGAAAADSDSEPAGAAAACGGGVDGRSRGVLADGGPGGPPSLASFMIGTQQPAHRGSGLQVQQGTAAAAAAAAGATTEAPPAAVAAAAVTAAAVGGVAEARAAVGVKRLRSLEAALLGRKVQRVQPELTHSARAAATTTPAAATDAAADATEAAGDGSLDSCVVEPDEDADSAQGGAAVACTQPARTQPRQRGPPLPLSAFQLGGAAASQLDSSTEQQQATQPAAAPAAAPTTAGSEGGGGGGGGGGAAGRGGVFKRGGASGGGQGQRCLAAYGFNVVARQQDQQQQQQQLDSSCDVEAGVSNAAPSRLDNLQQAQHTTTSSGAQQDLQEEQQQQEEEEEGPDGGISSHDEQQQPQQRGARNKDEGTDADVVEIMTDDDDDDDDDDVLLAAEQHHQGPQQQQQQQQQTGRVGCDQPLVLDYDMQQLMSDVQLRLQQVKLCQQHQQGVAEGAGMSVSHPHTQLTAASLQGADGDGTGTGATPASPDAGAATAGGAGGVDAATSELMRVFNKADFAQMQAVGQFNLGFIIARLRGDLFIVDQHAADEKSTFERLMGSYTVNKQPLLQPRRLATLTPMDQQTIREHMDIFKRNGFDFVDSSLQHTQQLWSKPPRSKPAAAVVAAQTGEVAATGAGPGGEHGGPAVDSTSDGDGDGGDAQGVCGDGDDCGSELLLSAVPVLKGGGAGGGVLGEEVLLELLDLIAAGETRPEDIRPKKVRDVLASRACRTSIMIGSPLTRQQQGRILARLADLDAPFNCPHGRPTMRHLAVMPQHQAEEQKA